MNNEIDFVTRDRRTAHHEASHLVVGLVLGETYGGATIEGSVEHGYEGLCWGPRYESRFDAGEVSTTAAIEQIGFLMPGEGDRDADVALAFQQVFNRITSLCAGTEGEKLACGDEWLATSDRQQEQALAALLYSSSEAQAMLVAVCAAEARMILQRHADVVDALAALLIKRRTIDEKQIVETVARTVQARQLAEDQERRRAWREIVARAAVSANQFEQHRDRT